MDDWEEVNVENLKLNDDIPSNDNQSTNNTNIITKDKDSVATSTSSTSNPNISTPTPTSTPGLYVNIELGTLSGIPSTLLDALNTPKERFKN